MTSDLVTLSVQLEAREKVIERGLKTFIEVGQALAEIKEQKLYRQEYSTFEEYCHSRWQLARTRAYELISAAETAKKMSEISSNLIPENEGQAKQLRGLTAEIAVQVMRQANEDTDGKVTASAIRDAREKITNPPVDIPADGILEVACNFCGTFASPDVMYEAGGGGWECETCVNADAIDAVAALQPLETSAGDRRPARKPLPDAFNKRVWEVMRPVESLQKLLRDDRFGHNGVNISRRNLPELLRARQALDEIISALQTTWKGIES